MPGNAIENLFVTDAAVRLADVGTWIGFTAQEEEAFNEPARFRRADTGAAINQDFQAFGPGEPNDALGTEDCVELNRDGTWNDLDCLDASSFVCEL
jgi:hypothetical protein